VGHTQNVERTIKHGTNELKIGATETLNLFSASQLLCLIFGIWKQIVTYFDNMTS
jgi:hypothetical protein